MELLRQRHCSSKQPFWVPELVQPWVQPHLCPCSPTWLGVTCRMNPSICSTLTQAETWSCFCVLAMELLAAQMICLLHSREGIFLEQLLPQVLSKVSVLAGAEEN